MPHEGTELGPASPEEIRVRQLIERGEAIDLMDAYEAVREEHGAEIYRTMETEEVLGEIRERLQNPETQPPDRWDMSFALAVIETAETPDEREFLFYNMFRDQPKGRAKDDGERRRQENTDQRLDRKIAGAAGKIGRERARELFNLYRIRFQELMDNYFRA